MKKPTLREQARELTKVDPKIGASLAKNEYSDEELDVALDFFHHENSVSSVKEVLSLIVSAQQRVTSIIRRAWLDGVILLERKSKVRKKLCKECQKVIDQL